MNIDVLINTLKRHEGIQLKPYRDTAGKLTIGVGRNLNDVGISKHEADMLLENDILTAYGDASSVVPNMAGFNEVRQNVIINMAFNLGKPRFMEFVKMIAALRIENFGVAADEMKDSRWYRQVGMRAKELVWQMRHGEIGTESDWRTA